MQGRIEPEYQGSPIFLSASEAVDPFSEASLSAHALKNPSGEAMEIREIRFQVNNDDDEIGGANMSCRLDLGKLPLTSGFIPIWNFGRGEDMVGETLETVGAGDKDRQFRWKLPRPLFIPAGGSLSAKLKHEGGITAALTGRVSYLGRTLPKGAPIPKKLAVPYISFYRSKAFSGSSADTDESSESDLQNPFDVPLMVERFTGRVATFYDGSSYEYLYPEIEMDLLTLKMIASNGWPLVRDYSVFGGVFDPSTRSWECPHLLDPGAFYKLQYSKLAASPGSGFGAGYSFRALVSMVGWREVSR